MRIVPYERPINPYQRAVNALVRTGYTVSFAIFSINQLIELGWRTHDIARSIRNDADTVYREIERFREEFDRRQDLVQTEEYEEGQVVEHEEPQDHDEPMMDVAFADGPADRQYAAVARRHSSKFGKKKRYTLKKVRHQLTLNEHVTKSRFQTFGDYFAGWGGKLINTQFPLVSAAGNYGTFPFHIWDVTSLPVAAQWSNAVMPCRGYQLAYKQMSPQGRDYSCFGWLPMHKALNSVGENLVLPDSRRMTDINIAIPTEATATNAETKAFGTTDWQYPYARGFTHNWSDIQMVLYPQQKLPTKWHVALITFPDDLVHVGENTTTGTDVVQDCVTAGPRLEYVNNFTDGLAQWGAEHTINSAFDARRVQNADAQNDLSLRWQQFWSGKLMNPINHDNSAVGTLNPHDSRLPFKILKHETFTQPARENPAFASSGAQRLIKKLFYRREWEFKPRTSDAEQTVQGDALFNMHTVQLNSHYRKDARNTLRPGHSSPFPTDSAITYLAIWCETFSTPQAETNDFPAQLAPGNMISPSYDLMVRMKHTRGTDQLSAQTHVPMPDGIPIATTADEPADEPLPPEEPIKKRKSKKTINAKETVSEGGQVSGDLV